MNRANPAPEQRRGLFWLPGPALIVAAVVCGPGSILTASRVGANFGHSTLWVLVLAVLLMIGMTAMAGRLGVALQRPACSELAARLGRPVALSIGLVIFLVVTGFQVGNNLAVVAALGPLFGNSPRSNLEGVAILAMVNALVLFALYRARHLYAMVERSMKWLVALMVLAFLGNWIAAGPSPAAILAGLVPRLPAGASAADWMALTGLFATTFSIAGAFYQSYLVRDKGWSAADLQRNLADSIGGIVVLGAITAIVLSTAASTFHGRSGVELATVGDVARQLEPLFGAWAKWLFSLGILAGALSSFLVNAMIGGQFLADGLGRGESMQAPWTRHGTALALLSAMALAILALATGWNHVQLIVVAQACTVLGGPALAIALLYLATRPDLRRRYPTPTWMLVLAWSGLAATFVLAARTVMHLL
jgi:Mn2+/Fe2+ NRAMP family transporter